MQNTDAYSKACRRDRASLRARAERAGFPRLGVAIEAYAIPYDVALGLINEATKARDEAVLQASQALQRARRAASR